MFRLNIIAISQDIEGRMGRTAIIIKGTDDT